jgi:hypothetical protein
MPVFYLLWNRFSEGCRFKARIRFSRMRKDWLHYADDITGENPVLISARIKSHFH